VGLARIKKKIDDLANLTPEYCRTERARCTYLHKAVVSEDWAKAEFSRARTSECTFEEMYQAMQGALQLHMEAIETRRAEGAALRVRSDAHGFGSPSTTYYDGQQVLQHPRNNPKSRTGQQQNKPLRNGKIPDCHNCGSKYHQWRQ
jgi:hypothetical protein